MKKVLRTSTFSYRLESQLNQWRDEGLMREISWFGIGTNQDGEPVLLHEGKNLIDFSSNDYLGFSLSPEIQSASRESMEVFGNGTRASRLICGSTLPFQELEVELARWKGTGSALFFATGYQMNSSVLPALTEAGDILIIDRLIHASLVDGAHLSKAKTYSFRHNDAGHLESRIEAALKNLPGNRHIFVVTEGLFSMDGDYGILREIAELKKRFPIVIVVDEAHSSGIMGPSGRGMAHESGVSESIDVLLGTGGKAMGVCGGFVCGSGVMIRWLQQKARGWMFSTAPPPGTVAGLIASVALIQSDEGQRRREKLWHNVRFFSQLLNKAPSTASPIIPILVGDETETMKARQELSDEGFWVGAVRYPAVHKNQARLRITLSAIHSEKSISRLARLINKLECMRNSE